MSECPFPIHFIQFDVAMYKGFFFKLPEHIIGREDVTVYVDYCPIGEDGKQVYVGVWAQIEGIPPAKYRFYHLTLPAKSLEKDETQTIISALNESPNLACSQKVWNERIVIFANLSKNQLEICLKLTFQSLIV